LITKKEKTKPSVGRFWQDDEANKRRKQKGERMILSQDREVVLDWNDEHFGGQITETDPGVWLIMMCLRDIHQYAEEVLYHIIYSDPGFGPGRYLRPYDEEYFDTILTTIDNIELHEYLHFALMEEGEELDDHNEEFIAHICYMSTAIIYENIWEEILSKQKSATNAMI